MGFSSRMCWISIMDVGPKIAVRASEDIEEDPDRWCSYSECGQELWQIACQWVWNLRLCLGQTMQGVQVRDTLVGPCQSSSCCLRSFRTLTARVWPVAVGRRVRTSHGAFRGRGLRVARGREAALPSRGQPVVERSASRECLYPASRLPGLPDGLSTLFFARAVSGIRSQRGSSPSC